jgi:hypothetical protein
MNSQLQLSVLKMMSPWVCPNYQEQKLDLRRRIRPRSVKLKLFFEESSRATNTCACCRVGYALNSSHGRPAGQGSWPDTSRCDTSMRTFKCAARIRYVGIQEVVRLPCRMPVILHLDVLNCRRTPKKEPRRTYPAPEPGWWAGPVGGCSTVQKS